MSRRETTIDTRRLRHATDTALVTVMCRAADAGQPRPVLGDRFAGRFVREYAERGRAARDLIGNRGEFVVTRSWMIDQILRRLAGAGLRVLVHLGAGFDCRPYRLDLSDELLTLEVDRAEILEVKERLLAGEAHQGTVRRRVGDLTRSSEVVRDLDALMPVGSKAVVLMEGVVPYLGEASVRQLAAELRTWPKATHWMTDICTVETAGHMVTALRQTGAEVDMFGLDDLSVFEDAGWQLIEYCPIQAALRRLYPRSSAGKIIHEGRTGLPDGVAVFSRA